jgi:serine/threonine protein kinase
MPDIRPANILRELDIELDELSVEQCQEKYPAYGYPVTRDDDRPIGKHVPETAYASAADFRKIAPEWTIEDAKNIRLADFGQASRPGNEPVRGRQMGIPLPFRCPESLMAPDEPVSYSADIWALACTIWTIQCGDSLFYSPSWFSGPWRPIDQMIAYQLQKLGTTDFPSAWQQIWQRDLLKSEVSDDNFDALPHQEPGATFVEQNPQTRNWVCLRHPLLEGRKRFDRFRQG